MTSSVIRDVLQYRRMQSEIYFLITISGAERNHHIVYGIITLQWCICFEYQECLIHDVSITRYLYKLYELHVSVENYTEAAFTLLLHADILKVTMLFSFEIFLPL